MVASMDSAVSDMGEIDELLCWVRPNATLDQGYRCGNGSMSVPHDVTKGTREARVLPME